MSNNKAVLRIAHGAIFAGLAAAFLGFPGAAWASDCDIHDEYQGHAYHVTVIYKRKVTPKRETRLFEAEFEIDRRAPFKEGDTAVVLIDGKRAGAQTLTRDRNGDLEIDLKYNSLRQSGPNQFPANFPPIGLGSEITVKIGKVTLPLCTF